METIYIEFDGVEIEVEYRYIPPIPSIDYDVPDDDEDIFIDKISVVIADASEMIEADYVELQKILDRNNLTTLISEKHGN